jgi:uncharacterized membrane protein YqjE
MSDSVRVHVPERSLASIIAEMKQEGVQFIQTRLDIFTTELQERLLRLKAAAPLGAVAVIAFATAFFMLSMALVGAISVAFLPNPYHWLFAFLIVGGTLGVLGGTAAILAYREIDLAHLRPQRTIEVLKADKLWLESETDELL